MANVKTIPGSSAVVRAEHFDSLMAAFGEVQAASGILPRVLGAAEVRDGIPGGGRTLVEANRAGSGAASDHYIDNAKGHAAVDIDNQRAIRNKIGSARFEAIMAKHGWRNIQINGAPFPSEPWHFARHVTVGAPAASGKLVVDGSRGPATTRRLQAELAEEGHNPGPIDGDFGPRTSAALQRKLGVKDDGVFGPISTRALQRYLGVTADGAWGPQTTRALQERLNADTF